MASPTDRGVLPGIRGPDLQFSSNNILPTQSDFAYFGNYLYDDYDPGFNFVPLLDDVEEESQNEEEEEENDKDLFTQSPYLRNFQNRLDSILASIAKQEECWSQEDQRDQGGQKGIYQKIQDLEEGMRENILSQIGLPAIVEPIYQPYGFVYATKNKATFIFLNAKDSFRLIHDMEVEKILDLKYNQKYQTIIIHYQKEDQVQAVTIFKYKHQKHKFKDITHQQQFKKLIFASKDEYLVISGTLSDSLNKYLVIIDQREFQNYLNISIEQEVISMDIVNSQLVVAYKTQMHIFDLEQIRENQTPIKVIDSDNNSLYHLIAINSNNRILEMHSYKLTMLQLPQLEEIYSSKLDQTQLTKQKSVNLFAG